MTEKRYFWIKLQMDFWKSPVVKMLRKPSGGDTYAVIYLEMILLSLENNGYIYYSGVGDSFAEEIALTLQNKYPDDHRPTTAIEKTRQWARGDIKMPEAKKAILAAHAMAKDITDVSDQALCHAIGQACGTVHVETHAIGLVFYELTATVRLYGIDDCEPMLIKRINEYQSYLPICAQHIHQYQWAKFISDDPHANKEYLLWLKRK